MVWLSDIGCGVRFAGGRVRGTGARRTLMYKQPVTGSLARRGVCGDALGGSRLPGPLLPQGVALLEARSRCGPAHLSPSRNSAHYGNAGFVAPDLGGRAGGGRWR